MPRFEHLVTATKRGSKYWRADFKDWFHQHILRSDNMRYAGLRDYDGKPHALVRMGQGFRNSSAIAQRTITMMIRALYRRMNSLGLHCASSMPEYDAEPTTATPGKSHELTFCGGFSDDAGCASTTWASSWFSFIHWLIITSEVWMQLGFKA